MITINQNNYKLVIEYIQDELNELNLNIPDWIMTDFIYYLYGNIVESSEDEVLFKVYDKVILKLEREEKINEILNGRTKYFES